jgi:Helix-turn-helix domain
MRNPPRQGELSILHIVKSGRKYTGTSNGVSPSEVPYAGRQARLRLSGTSTDREAILASRPKRRKHPIQTDALVAKTKKDLDLSVEMYVAAWRKKLGSSTDKLVLLALADHVRMGTDNCWPSISTLIEKTELSRRAIQGSLKRLTEKGCIKVIYTRNHSNTFTLWITPEQLPLTPRTTCAPPRTTCAPGGAPRAPIKVKEPERNLNQRERPLETVSKRQESTERLAFLRMGVAERKKRTR